jgi:hypothetical protein
MTMLDNAWFILSSVSACLQFRTPAMAQRLRWWWHLPSAGTSAVTPARSLQLKECSLPERDLSPLICHALWCNRLWRVNASRVSLLIKKSVAGNVPSEIKLWTAGVQYLEDDGRCSATQKPDDEPANSNPRPHTQFQSKFNIILSSMTRSGNWVRSFKKYEQNMTSFSIMRATYVVHLFLLNLITRMRRLTFQSTTDRIYDGGPIILSHNIIILTTVLQ